MRKNLDYKNVSGNDQLKPSSSDKVFLNFDSVETLIRRLQGREYKDALQRNNLLFDLIRIRQPISKYALAKISGLSYPTIKQICKWLEASDLIYSYQSIGENGMPVRLVTTDKEDKE